jgi:murein DD-endopeptidase MepM/ murein hydrolase activator NlpD
MKSIVRGFLVFLSFLSGFSVYAQYLKPDGGGEYVFPHTQCISESQTRAISEEISQNISALKAQGKLHSNASVQSVPTLYWPVQQSANFSYPNYYAVDNYVDLDTVNPDSLLDWNCGTRTYDLIGYNHAGVDIFLWPFSWNMMEAEQVEIISAADGIIVGLNDGNPDQNCDNSNPSWNAVYVQHAGGYQGWYGHMKTNSLTSKSIGDSVYTGEYLGLVGSSGVSLGPHLHFELHDSLGIVVDPYFGPCNTISASLWANQKPYYESALNLLLTHDSAPSFAACPFVDTIHAKDYFMPGDLVYFSTYYRDQLLGQNSTHTIYDPSNTIWNTWVNASTAPHYEASYWYWNLTLPSNAQTGTWRFEVTYENQTYSHDFYVGITTGASEDLAFNSLQVYPNPSTGIFSISGLDHQDSQVFIKTLQGNVVQECISSDSKEFRVSENIPSGFYLIEVQDNSGSVKTGKILITK